MKTMVRFYLVQVAVLLTATMSYAQITSAGSGNWSSAGTWVGDVVPTSADDVVIAAGHVVAVDNANADCKSISFGGTDSKIDMSTASSVLNIYGNFSAFSTAHATFSNWTSGAVIKFKGSAEQSFLNFPTSVSTTTQPFFRYLVVEKTGDTLRLPNADVKLNIVDSLVIESGNFVMGQAADLQGRSFDGSLATTPTITIKSGATFYMWGAGSHIGSGSTGTPRPQIGKITLFGTFYPRSTSTNKINFADMSIEPGGNLVIGGGSANSLVTGTITVKSGGQITNSVTTTVWDASSSVLLQPGGVFRTSSSTTVFPTTFTNNGTVWYARSTSGDQTVTDMDYSRLEFSFATSGHNKVWTLTANRTISDSLETNNTANLVVSAASAQTLNLNGTLRLTSGSIDNSDADVSLTLTEGVTISRATGTITTAPVFTGNHTIRYTSTTTNVTTGPELPSSVTNLYMASSQTVTLGASTTVTGTLTLANGTLALNGTSSTFGTIVGLGGALAETQSLNAPSSANVGDLGALITSSADLGTTTVRRGYNALTGNSNSSILRWYDIIPATNTGLNATLVFPYTEGAELNGIAEADLRLFKSTDNGTTWTMEGGTVDQGANTVTLTGIDGFSRWTLGSVGAPLPVELTSLSTSVNGKNVTVQWTTATESNNHGFEIERKELHQSTDASMNQWVNLGFVEGAGNSNAPRSYSFVDASASGKVEYRLKQIDRDGSFSYSSTVEANIALSPDEYSLHQNFPNPFNPTTVIRFAVPNDQHVTVKVYNMLGQEVRTLFNGVASGGEMQSVNFDATNLSAGVYYYSMTTPDRSDVKKMLLLK